jgi:hypothetical protein
MSDVTGGNEMASEPDWHIDGLPDALVKACSDPLDYAMGLRTGSVIRFESATLSEDHQWVHVAVQPRGYDADGPDVMTGCPFTFLARESAPIPSVSTFRSVYPVCLISHETRLVLLRENLCTWR